MKIKVVDERVFPTLGIIAKAGESVELPDTDDAGEVKSKKAVKALDAKENSNGIAEE